MSGPWFLTGVISVAVLWFLVSAFNRGYEVNPKGLFLSFGIAHVVGIVAVNKLVVGGASIAKGILLFLNVLIVAAIIYLYIVLAFFLRG